MTGIRPTDRSLVPPIAPEQPLAPIRSTDSKGFSDWLAVTAGRPLAPLTSGEEKVNPARLSTALAELFNAHGFFAAEPELSVGDWLGQSPEGRLPAPPSAAQAGNSVQQHITGEPRAQQRAVDHMPPFAPGSAPPLAAAGAVHRSDHAQPLTVARAHAAPNSAVALGVRGSPAPEAVGPQPANGASRPRLPGELPANQSSDRILVRIGEAAVELVGRLEALSEDEEERLLADLTALLAEHGLSLGSATINGTTLARGRLRGRG